MSQSLPSSSLSANIVDSIAAPEFEYHGVNFRVTRLLPTAGLAVMAYVWPALASIPDNSHSGIVALFSDEAIQVTLAKLGMPGDLAVFAVRVVNLALSLPPDLIERLRVDLFHSTSYKTRDMSDFASLFNMEDDAFASMPFTAQYVVLGRAAAVNFYDCIEEVRSLISGS